MSYRRFTAIQLASYFSPYSMYGLRCPGGGARGHMTPGTHTKSASCGARGESRVVPPLPVVEPGGAPSPPLPGLPSSYAHEYRYLPGIPGIATLPGIVRTRYR